MTAVARQDRGCDFEVVGCVDGVGGRSRAVADPVQDLWSHESAVEEGCVGCHFSCLARLGLTWWCWCGCHCWVLLVVGVGTGTERDVCFYLVVGQNVCDFLSVFGLFAQDGQ